MTLSKKKSIENEKKNFDFVTGLDQIFIIGKGVSALKTPEQKPEKAEYWGANDIFKLPKRDIDRIFIMRDLYVTEQNKGKGMVEELNKLDKPVYTLGLYPELVNNVAYPMKAVIEEYSDTYDRAYFLNTASYMLALAIMLKPKKICLFGVDMSFGSRTEYMRNEKACLEHWIGMAIGRDIDIQLTPESTLMKRQGYENYYGMKLNKPDKDHPHDPVTLSPKFIQGKGGKCAKKYELVHGSLVKDI
jgi:hypothetical protein